MTSAIPTRPAVLWQLSYQAIWELVTLLVRNIPVDSEEYEWIYERPYIWTAEKKTDMKTLFVIAVEHWTGVAEVMG